jgi:RNA 2',3'-cyclic 3'-phosphodiesterase
MHLTLSFLGDVRQETVEHLSGILSIAAKRCSPFYLNLSGCGVFPSPEKARVIWVGTKKGTIELITIKSTLDELLPGIGFETEKRIFKPHLTLGRFRYSLDKNIIATFLEQGKNFQTSAAMISKFVLFESQLTNYGAVYHPLQLFEFN